uniref:Uncharacterized protein n=1 Tax=Parascaris equorum TaxID=6256 RepID=A0A914RXG5_PAREQ
MQAQASQRSSLCDEAPVLGLFSSLMLSETKFSIKFSILPRDSLDSCLSLCLNIFVQITLKRFEVKYFLWKFMAINLLLHNNNEFIIVRHFPKIA